MDKTVIANRLKKNYQRLKSYLLGPPIEAFRLYYHDIPEFPFYADILKNHVMVYDRRVEMDFQKHEDLQLQYFLEALRNFLDKENMSVKEEHFHLKLRKAQKDGQYEKLKEPTPEDFFWVQEGPFKFRLNCESYLDYGLFLDHRVLRQVLYKQCKQSQNSSEIKALNLFSYTGAISVALAMGGAKVTSIDLSNTYLDWSKQNFKLNQLELGAHQFIQADVLSMTKESMPKSLELYDLIVCDPPSFSNSKRMKEDFDVQGQHTELIVWCMKHLKQNGTLYFSNNLKDFRLDSTLKERMKIEDITTQTTPLDFLPRRPHWAFKINH